MNGTMIRALVAAGIALAAPGLPGVEAAGAAGVSPGAALSPTAAATRQAADPGSELWVARHYAGQVRAVAVSPDGTRVYVTGTAYRSRGQPCTTVAYDAATGAALWVRSYGGSGYAGSGGAKARAVAVSPDGTKVFVTGSSPASGYPRIATVAYDAATGAQLWAARYRGPYPGGATAAGLAVSPDGARVFVAGTQFTRARGGGDSYYATIAYSAATGSQEWARLYNGTLGGPDHATAVAVSPRGSKVFVTGTSGGRYATVAYLEATGSRRWASRYDGPGNGSDAATAITVGPGGGQVFVTGYSDGGNRTHRDYATVAYNSMTGVWLWCRRYNGPGNGDDTATAIAVSPNGTERAVFVTGYSDGGNRTHRDYATVAYNTLTGMVLWVSRYNGPGNGADSAWAVAVSPDGRVVAVTGGSDGGATRSDFATISYDAASGQARWVTRYDGPGSGSDSAAAVAVSPRGNAVFVAGTSSDGSYYATVAYRA